MILSILFVVFMIGAAFGGVLSALWWCGTILLGLPPMTEDQMVAISVFTGIITCLSLLGLFAVGIWTDVRGR
jgi:hypothetical protein